MRTGTAAILAAALALGACATPEGFQRIANSWVNSTELELVRGLGPPTSSHEVSGRKFMVYARSGSMQLGGVAPTYTTTRIGNTYYTQQTGGVAPSTVQLHCTLTFELVAGIVITWSAQGNHCVAE